MILASIYAGLPDYAHAQQFRGQFSAWGIALENYQEEFDAQIGIRYLPELQWRFAGSRAQQLDITLSGNLFRSRSLTDREQLETRWNSEFYRAWIRYADRRFEARFGLQKINFGPAKLLRSLMWFDQLDPRDPLQFTRGVTGLRLRYDCRNLAGIWLWGLYGDGETKGLEFAPTRDSSPEIGGRFQHPLGPGELAVTGHSRTTDPSLNPDLGLTGSDIPEYRVALDGTWDVGIGLWFETALLHADYSADIYDWQTFQTIGADYTLPWGNGLHILGEHMLVTISDVPYDLDEKIQNSGIMLSYPIGWLDQITVYSIYNWDEALAYHYLSWQRTYDRWVFHLGLYAIAGNGNFPAFAGQETASPGKRGVQLMVIFNH